MFSFTVICDNKHCFMLCLDSVKSGNNIACYMCGSLNVMLSNLKLSLNNVDQEVSFLGSQLFGYCDYKEYKNRYLVGTDSTFDVLYYDAVSAGVFAYKDHCCSEVVCWEDSDMLEFTT